MVAGLELVHLGMWAVTAYQGEDTAVAKRYFALDQRLLAYGRAITDANNPVAMDLAASQLLNRRYVVEALPAAFFVN